MTLPSQPVLTAQGLRKAFGDRAAVDDVSFQINAGETYGFLGPNGAGKTTTISMVAGMLSRDAGEVTVCDIPVDTDALDAKQVIGLVPQHIALYPDLSGRENLAFFGQLYGIRGDDLKRRLDEVLGIVELADRAGDKVEEYSGGMQRRLNIAVGLLHTPQLLILDEPTVGVDPQSRNAILESVERLGAEGMAVLYTTHYMEEAERLCDRVGILDEGRLIAEGTRSELVTLIGGLDRIDLAASGGLEDAAAAITEVPGVEKATTTDGAIHVMCKNAPDLLAEVLGHAARSATVTRVEVLEPNLEAVFLHLTGKALRE